MEIDKLLQGKKVLVVDDEPDILDVLTELLSTCMVDRASTFETAREFLETVRFDVVVLDIMGVQGFELLDVAKQKKVPALMLTARALNNESLKRSAEEGACYFVPKEKITEIAVFVADVVASIEKSKNPWVRWVERLSSFFDENKNFSGPNWREQHKKFWDEKLQQFPGI